MSRECGLTSRRSPDERSDIRGLVGIPHIASLMRTTGSHDEMHSSLIPRQQRRVAAGGGRVDRHRLLRSKTRQIMRAAGFGAGARQAMAAERLHPDHRADHVAVDVDVADLQSGNHVLDGIVDPRVNAEGQPVAGARDRTMRSNTNLSFDDADSSRTSRHFREGLIREILSPVAERSRLLPSRALYGNQTGITAS